MKKNFNEIKNGLYSIIIWNENLTIWNYWYVIQLKILLFQ
jgi:hypothetical protein